MKKLLFALMAVAFMASSCSKEAKLNKKLDGTWNVTKMNGGALPSGSSIKMTFSKEKKGKGDYTVVSTFPPLPAFTETGTYTLEEDTRIYTTATGASTADTMVVASYSKTDLKLTNVAATMSYEATKE